MSQRDPIDGRIREALADLVSHAPLAPDFDDMGEGAAPERARSLHPMALVAAALVAVVIAGAALAGTGDTTVDTGMDPREVQRDVGAGTECEERAAQLAAEEADVLVFLQPETSRTDHEVVAQMIKDAPDVEVVRFVDQRATYDEFRALFADAPEIVESVTAEILPPRFEVRVAGSSSNDVVTDLLGLNPAVREVVDADQARTEMVAQCRDGDPTDTSGWAADTTVAAPGGPVANLVPRLRIVDGTSDSEVGVDVANTLARGVCGFDVRLVDDPEQPLIRSRVVTTEEFTALGEHVAEIVGAELSTVAEPVQSGDGSFADIVVELAPSYSSERLDPSTCPIEELWAPGGFPPPGTAPLVTVEYLRVDGTPENARIDTPFRRSDGQGICISFNEHGGAGGCGGVAVEGELAPFAGTNSDTSTLLAVTAPGDAALVEATDGTRTTTGRAVLLPDPYADRTVAILDLTSFGDVTALVARDVDGREVARTTSVGDL